MLGATIFAATAPTFSSGNKLAAPQTTSFPGWPERFENRPLKALELTQKERLFAQDFPGAIGRFTDGRREIILRWVETPTRRLHPATDCFAGVGFATHALPLQHNDDGVPMGCFTATRDEQTLRVCEYITAAESADNSESWSDVSSWYWQAVFNNASQGWWSVVIAENAPMLR